VLQNIKDIPATIYVITKEEIHENLIRTSRVSVPEYSLVLTAMFFNGAFPTRTT